MTVEARDSMLLRVAAQSLRGSSRCGTMEPKDSGGQCTGKHPWV